MAFTAALVITAKTCKKPRRPSAGEWVHCGTPSGTLLGPKSKFTRQQVTKRLGGNFSAFHQVREASLKRPRTARCQLYDTWKRQNDANLKDPGSGNRADKQSTEMLTTGEAVCGGVGGWVQGV
ncbi:hypothetical protein HJG60_008405 [Phyllostomus discolor]|uniref:Uncharacterized protein n=1 Tax=Phyllostomus discolor TaxID=89673 RepID=A0A833Z2X5_9CHIR|nr:hypothetical protein HJG60_008405 [Phyllostomus discolor]